MHLRILSILVLIVAMSVSAAPAAKLGDGETCEAHNPDKDRNTTGWMECLNSFSDAAKNNGHERCGPGAVCWHWRTDCPGVGYFDMWRYSWESASDCVNACEDCNLESIAHGSTHLRCYKKVGVMAECIIQYFLMGEIMVRNDSATAFGKNGSSTSSGGRAGKDAAKQLRERNYMWFIG